MTELDHVGHMHAGFSLSVAEAAGTSPGNQRPLGLALGHIERQRQRTPKLSWT